MRDGHWCYRSHRDSLGGWPSMNQTSISGLWIWPILWVSTLRRPHSGYSTLPAAVDLLHNFICRIVGPSKTRIHLTFGWVLLGLCLWWFWVHSVVLGSWLILRRSLHFWLNIVWRVIWYHVHLFWVDGFCSVGLPVLNELVFVWEGGHSFWLYHPHYCFLLIGASRSNLSFLGWVSLDRRGAWLGFPSPWLTI